MANTVDPTDIPSALAMATASQHLTRATYEYPCPRFAVVPAIRLLPAFDGARELVASNPPRQNDDQGPPLGIILYY